MGRFHLPSRAFFRRLSLYISWKIRFGFDGNKFDAFQLPPDPDSPNSSLHSIHGQAGTRFLVGRRVPAKGHSVRVEP